MDCAVPRRARLRQTYNGRRPRNPSPWRPGELHGLVARRARLAARLGAQPRRGHLPREALCPRARAYEVAADAEPNALRAAGGSSPRNRRADHRADAAAAQVQADEGITIPTSVQAALTASDAEFAPAHEDIVGDLEMLDRLDYDPSCGQVVRRQIDDVIAQEAPIASARLARIVDAGSTSDASRPRGLRVSSRTCRRVSSSTRRSVASPGPLTRTPTPTTSFASPTARRSAAWTRLLRPNYQRHAIPSQDWRWYLARRARARNSRDLRLLADGREDRGHLESIVNHGVQRGRLQDDGTAIFVAD